MIQRTARNLRRIRSRASGLALRGFFEGLSRAGALHPKAKPARHGVERLRGVPYLDDEHPSHTLDIYRPVAPAGPLPALLYIHGGAFHILSKDTHWLMALAFARRGFVVFNVDYRLAPTHRFPAAIEDVCHAARWVVEHAARYGADAERLVITGESAGGNLATAVTVASCYRRPEPWAAALFDAGARPIATIAACGILQVSDTDRFARRRKLPTVVADQLRHIERGYLPSERGDLSMADPLVFLERGLPPDRALPPFFAFAGTRDPLLPDTRRLAVALEALGVRCDARYYPGGLHAFHALPFDARARDCWRDQFRFLREVVPR